MITKLKSKYIEPKITTKKIIFNLLYSFADFPELLAGTCSCGCSCTCSSSQAFPVCTGNCCAHPPETCGC